MGNKVSNFCVPIKSKIRNLPNSSTTTIVPSITRALDSNNVDTPLPQNHTIPPFICQICLKSKPLSDSFNVEGCAHFYCTQCIVNYIISKLEKNVINLVCPEPGCSGVLNPNYCKPILPKNVSLWWERDLSESVIPEKLKFYCPYYDCSALLINDGIKGEAIRDSSCPHCKRSICVQCKVPWHPRFTCEMFQRMKVRDQNDDCTNLGSEPPGLEKGESSNSNTVMAPFVCEICTETKTQNDAFRVSCYCSHSYCIDCVVMYVESKLQENIVTIRCPEPECQAGILEIEHCSGILPKEVYDHWGNALCEAVIVVTQKFYCPFKDCSALLIDDGNEVVKQAECPNCRRLFCAQCKVAWHHDIACEEFQKLNKDEREKEDIILMNLAKSKKWRRCSRCRIYVEKTEGCMYMKCRCGHIFCYNCGATHIDKFEQNHYCYNCKRIW